MSGFGEGSHLSLEDIILTDFHNLMLHGHLFTALALWARESALELRLYVPRGVLAAEMAFQFLSCQKWVCGQLFSPSSPPYHLHVASVNPWLLDFCSASLLLFIQVDCSIF